MAYHISQFKEACNLSILAPDSAQNVADSASTAIFSAFYFSRSWLWDKEFRLDTVT